MSRWLVAAVAVDPETLMDGSIDGTVDEKCRAAVNRGAVTSSDGQERRVVDRRG